MAEQDFAAKWLGLAKDASGEYVLTAKSVINSIGGKWGLVESAIPPMSFSLSFGVYKNVYLSVGLALSLTLLVAIGQIIRKRPIMNAFASFLGVGLAAWLATNGGADGASARDFFLKDFAVNGVWIVGLLVSIAIGRPAFGYLAHALSDVPDNWRTVKFIRAKMSLMTLFWVILFSTRLLVELPLYLANDVVMLGYVKTALGLPFFALWITLSWLFTSKPSKARP